MFVHDGEQEDEDNKDKGGGARKTSATCRDFEEGTCAYKIKHTWKECPRNPWIINKGISYNAKENLCYALSKSSRCSNFQ